MPYEIGNTVTSVVTGAAYSVSAFLPRLLGGLVLILVGWLLASLLREVVDRVVRALPLESWANAWNGWLRSGRDTRRSTVATWADVLAELVRWSVLILFLAPAVEALGLPKVTDVLNQVLLYLPNVFVSVVVGFVGLALSRVVANVVSSSARALGSHAAQLLANLARYAVVFFTALVVLNQLGVASDLVRILFTGIVAMLALAGGIAFGLGGQTTARRVLDDFATEVGMSRAVSTSEIRPVNRVKRRAKRARR